MGYETANAQGQPFMQPQVATAVRAKTGMSKWWPISFFIAAVIFFIIGGGLIGAWASSATSYTDSYDSYDYTYYYSYNSGEYYGALACFALGGICKFVAWVLLIVWCVKRSRSRTVVVTQAYEPYQSYGNYVAPVAPQGYAPVPVPSPAPVPPYGNAQTASNQTGGPTRYCTNCGTAVTTPFCSQCGIKG